MSLLQEAMEDFAIVKQVTSSDGYGGEITEFETISTFKGALVFNTSSEILVARSQNVVSAYTLTTNKDVILEYHTLIKKVSNNKILRVTSDGDDKYTPNSALLNMRQVTCEEYSI